MSPSFDATGNFAYTGDTFRAESYLDFGLSQRLFSRLDRWELPLVRAVVASSAHPALRMTSKAFNWLGNGWLYAPAALTLVLIQWQHAARMIVAAGLSASLCFTVYSWLKRRLARVRPCHLDPALTALVEPLDYYSCPSGHCMAATAVAIPLIVGLPIAIPAVACIWTLVAWSRVSTGHHFPSDLMFGALLGGLVAVPVSLIVL